MKNVIVRLAVISALLVAMASCGGKDDKRLDITGEWKLSSAANLGPGVIVKSSDDVEVTVYLSLSSDGKFVLYQRIGDGRFRMYDGTWQLSGTMLTGKYGDSKQTPWGSGYIVSLEDGGNTLVMVPESFEQNVMHYGKASIPSSVKDEALAGN